MPNATIQGVLKKCATQSIKLKQHILEIRHGFKVFMVVVLYTENLANSKMFMAPLIKKSGSSFADTQHMFFDKGIVEVVGNDKLETKTSDELEEIATEHAIECGAEELEIIDANTKHLTVKMWRTWSLDSVIIQKKILFSLYVILLNCNESNRNYRHLDTMLQEMNMSSYRMYDLVTLEIMKRMF